MQWFEQIARGVVRSALLWGALASVGFYAGVHYAQPYINPFLLRCLSGRWEAYVCVSMFLVGVAALVIRAVDLAPQFFVLRQTMLSGPISSDQSPATAKLLIKQLDSLSALWQRSYLVRRLRDALEFVIRKGGNEGLDEQLRYLADMDTSRMNASYGLPRFLTWAIPAIGSLGTVLGIATAIAHLSAESASDPLTEVTAGLAVAFDTTALALALSTILMLGKFICEQQEAQLLLRVEDRAQQDLCERMGRVAATRAGQPDQMRQLMEKLVAATDQLAQRPSLPQQAGGDFSTATANQLESLVSQAVSKAITGSGGMPMAQAPNVGGLVGIEQVQQALQQIATFFQFQQAEQIEQHEVVKQLSDIIHERPDKPAGAKQPVRRAAKDSSLVGLWGSPGE